MNQIKIGDAVTVEWENLEPVSGIVQYMPQGPGDGWIIKAPASAVFGLAERTIAIQTYARITKLST